MLSLAACAEDVGACDGSNGGEDTVVTGGHVEFAGQAILNKACASCHGSGVAGASRAGAPAGLNFDLSPIPADDSFKTKTNDSGQKIAKLDADALSGLRARQRKVYAERNQIWQQVRDGLMPPRGKFLKSWDLSSIFDSEEDSPCARGDKLAGIDDGSAQEVLRNWLACQAPIVEAYGGPIADDKAEGDVGYQYAECSAGVGDTIVLEDIYTDVFEGFYCAGCHPGVDTKDPLSLTGLDEARKSLLSSAPTCSGKPYVTPGKPEESFLIDVVSQDDPGGDACDVGRMPDGFGVLPSKQVDLLRQWIMQGAKSKADLE